MSKTNIEYRKASKIGKKSSHTGNKPLVQSPIDSNVMVTQKVYQAQKNNKKD